MTRSRAAWRLRGDRWLDLSAPRLMGILNATPDSFHGDSRVMDAGTAVAAAASMAAAGAAMVDIGAESTRPGAARVPAGEQIRRLEPVFRAVVGAAPTGAGASDGVLLSVDTTSAEVADAALAWGAHAVNDISAGLDDPEMFAVAAGRGCGLVLMHRALPPERDSYSDRYATPPMDGNVVEQVRAFLGARAEAAIGAGVDASRIVLDPGLGFGKSVEQNLALIRGLPRVAALGFPVLVGVSRKSFVGRLGDPSRDTSPADRLAGSLALALAMVGRGAAVIRVHDVAEHAQALRVWAAVHGGGSAG